MAKNKNIILPEKPTLSQKAKYQSEIKRINQRISEIAKQFGTDNDVYKSVISKLENVSAGQYTHINAKGVLQLNNSYKTLQTTGGTYTFNVGRKIPTLTQLKTRYGVDPKTSIKNAKEEIEQKQGMATHFTEVWEKVYSENGLTDSEIRKVAPEMWKNVRGERKLTYSELDNISKRLEDKFVEVTENDETPF